MKRLFLLPVLALALSASAQAPRPTVVTIEIVGVDEAESAAVRRYLDSFMSSLGWQIRSGVVTIEYGQAATTLRTERVVWGRR